MVIWPLVLDSCVSVRGVSSARSIIVEQTVLARLDFGAFFLVLAAWFSTGRERIVSRYTV